MVDRLRNRGAAFPREKQSGLTAFEHELAESSQFASRHFEITNCAARAFPEIAALVAMVCQRTGLSLGELAKHPEIRVANSRIKLMALGFRPRWELICALTRLAGMHLPEATLIRVRCELPREMDELRAWIGLNITARPRAGKASEAQRESASELQTLHDFQKQILGSRFESPGWKSLEKAAKVFCNQRGISERAASVRPNPRKRSHGGKALRRHLRGQRAHT